MKVTLVNPPYPPNVHSHPPFIPLGIAYLGAVAEKQGHQVTVIDCQAEKLTTKDFRKRIKKIPSDVVGVTATTLLYKSAMKLITIAKQENPQATTILGGSHGTFWDINALNEYPSLNKLESICALQLPQQFFVLLWFFLKNEKSGAYYNTTSTYSS